MTIKVLQFKPVGPDAPQINETIVQYLKNALELAEKGELTDLAMAFRLTDKTHTTCFEGPNQFSSLGALEYLAHRLKVVIHES